MMVLAFAVIFTCTPSYTEEGQELLLALILATDLGVGFGFLMVSRELSNDVVKNEMRSVPRTKRNDE